MDRYRISGILGRGGMGEIYLADDLKLDQSVALKFLPPELSKDSSRLDAIYREVRIARQVSHANVCRTYDIGELDGTPFISMEYVDGEDLASLLKRIGRLPGERAIEIARQICAGLAAAHDRGVLHRDLKPSNVMIDGEGRVRITDFGLSGLASEFSGADIRSGTPAYMAPEQFAGTEVTAKSDIYSLGLVLYEMFTGKPAFRAATLRELAQKHREEPPTSPSQLLVDLDPAVERVILRCLEKDPRARPASALAVAAALPGGDPLAAALAAGETPSPELVAAAGDEGTMRPAYGWLALAIVVLGMVAIPLLNSATLFRRTPLPKPPVVLAERAREIARDLGYPDPPIDSAHGFGDDVDLIRYVSRHDTSPTRWNWIESDRPAAIRFWYRQSPFELVATSPEGVVLPKDPPEDQAGMFTMFLDPEGRLLEFRTVPRQVEDSLAVDGGDPDWGRLFVAAGLDMSAFTPVSSRWTPPYHADRRAAWEGSLDASTNDTGGMRADRFPVRIEAAAYRGKPIYFEIVGDWTRPARDVEFELRKGQRVSQIMNLLIVIIGLTCAGLLARRNVRLGRGDRRGALRLAICFAVLILGGWALLADHSRNVAREWNLFANAMGGGLFIGLVVWVLYLALEPMVRRRWPDLIISWTRLLSGRMRDPMVGRDFLIGAAVGSFIAVLQQIQFRLPAWLGMPPAEPDNVAMAGLYGFRGVAAMLMGVPIGAVVNALFFLFLPVGLLKLLKREWAAFGVSLLILATVVVSQDSNPGISLVMDTLQLGMALFLIRRVGLLAGASSFFFTRLLSEAPLTFDTSAWYAPNSAALLIVPLIAVVAAFRLAVRGAR